MRIELINQWGDVLDFYKQYRLIHADLSIVFVNIEYSLNYKAVYFIVLGVGIEVVLQEDDDIPF